MGKIYNDETNLLTELVHDDFLDQFTPKTQNGLEEIEEVNALDINGHIDMALSIFLKKDNPNIAFVGPDGCGKTITAKAVANMINKTDSGYKVYKIRCDNILSTCANHPDAMSAWREFFDEIKSVSNVILFIDDFGETSNFGAVYGCALSDIMSMYGIPGGIKFLITCDTKDYTSILQTDVVFNRAFEIINMDSITNAQTIDLMKFKCHEYEEFHRIDINENVIPIISNAADRHLSHSAMPQKALDLLDMSCANLRKSRDLNVKMQSDMSEFIDHGAKEYYMEYLKRYHNLNEDHTTSEILKLDEVVVLETVSQMSGIPLSKITMSEKANLRELHANLSKKVLGQESAIDRITKTIKRNRLGIRKSNHTVGNFLFVGSSGCGKTELCKQLAINLFGEERALQRFDMSEYMESISVNKLIGSPPGYVGYGSGGLLTNAIIQHPYSIILFDEIEKAHQDVYNVLLQLLDEGHITDSTGKKADARNCIIIMTSNVGTKRASQFSNGLGFSLLDKESIKAQKEVEIIEKEMESHFPPEFRGRIDDIVIFNNLNNDIMKLIFDKELNDLQDILKENNYDITLNVNDEIRQVFVDKALEQNLGARPLQHLIREHIEDKLTDALLDIDNIENVSLIFDVLYDKDNDNFELKYVEKEKDKETDKLSSVIGKSKKSNSSRRSKRTDETNSTECSENV